jgi:hypothetical protein
MSSRTISLTSHSMREIIVATVGCPALSVGTSNSGTAQLPQPSANNVAINAAGPFCMFLEAHQCEYSRATRRLELFGASAFYPMGNAARMGIRHCSAFCFGNAWYVAVRYTRSRNGTASLWSFGSRECRWNGIGALPPLLRGSWSPHALLLTCHRLTIAVERSIIIIILP